MLLIARWEELLCLVELHTQEDGQHLLELVSWERRVQRCSKPRDDMADEAIVPYWEVPSCVLDFAESILPGLSRFHHFVPDESPAMASTSTFYKGRTCSLLPE